VCGLQGLQSKLDDCKPLEDSLRHTISLLSPVCDKPETEQLATELAGIISRHGNTSDEVETRIRQLEARLRSWDEVRVGMSECSQTLSDAQSFISTDVTAPPVSRRDLQLQANRIKVVNVQSLKG